MTKLLDMLYNILKQTLFMYNTKEKQYKTGVLEYD